MPGINFVDLTNRPDLDSRIKSAFHFFANVTVPAAVAGEPPPVALELNAEGWKTPVIASNPNAFYLGCTTEGWNITNEEQTEEQRCDEQVDPESIITTSRTLAIEGNLLGVEDPTILTQLYGMTRWDNQPADTNVHLGANPSGAKPSMPVIALYQLERPNAPGTFRFGYFLFPNCEQTATYPAGRFSRTQRLTCPVRFVAKGFGGYGGRPYTKYLEE